MAMPQTQSWFERIPKVELHLHIEGAIPLAALWELIRKYGGDREVGSPADLADRFRFRDFGHFIETWIWKNRFLREYEDFTFIARAVALDLAAQRVVHAEAFFSPTDFAQHGIEPARLAEAIRKGLDQVPAVDVLLVADLVRDQGPERAARTLASLEGTRDLGVVGIGIGGSEHLFPPAPFAAVYERARRLGLRTSAHAGEAAGPESVWSAIEDLRVDRIGHGTRACEDPNLIATLAEKRVHVEACPFSNVRTGVTDRLADHPVRRLFDAGVRVSVSTDDPAMFGTRLSEEFAALHGQLGFGADDIRALVLQAAQDCWLVPDRKARLIESLRADPTLSGDL
jgi:adenosine deaminase